MAFIKNHTIGVDVGGTNIRAAVVENKKIISPILTKKTPDNFEQFKKTLSFFVSELAKKYHFNKVGIGIPGAVDREDGKIIFAPSLSYLNGRFFDELLSEYKVKVGNDVDLALLAEIIINDLNKKNLLLLNVGTGLGSAFCISGNASWNCSFSGEAGHMKVIKDGRKCHCGGRGCLEAYFSGWAILEQANEKAERHFKDAEEVFEKAREGDGPARKIINDNTKILGLGIANLINITGADTIIIGGKLSQSLDLIINSLRNEIEKHIYASKVRYFEVHKSSLVDQSTIIGASLLDNI